MLNLKDVLDETKLTEGLAQAIGAAIINARLNIEEVLDTYEIQVTNTIRFVKKEKDKTT
jgi:hypothetical protein